ncbi:MAG: hypothetical protein Pg6C_20190 [Treponemataceae bacterium]|nr:MAG: hypothetical protein Pg6C_20190 [Treponemataceae bacterium]
MVVGTYTPDDLISGKFPIIDEPRIIPSGTAAFKRGCVLTAANIPVVSATAANVDCIALEDCDASAGAVRCAVAIAGAFNNKALSAGDSTDPATFKAALRAKSIYIAKALDA